ncbi:MAG: hypothetical protein ACI35W_03880 [Anaeroplasmataceae bacterium]
MDLITDYGNWKFENYELIDTLIKNNSNIIRRFPHVLIVVDHFYNLVTHKNYTLSKDEEVIFETGFNYVFEHFNTINLILTKYFNNNINEMERISKTINLLLYTNDFERELENKEKEDLTAIKKLNDFEQRVLKYIEQRLEAPDEMFALLNDITSSIFDEYYGINEIMYDISVELGLAPDEDEDEYNIMF